MQRYVATLVVADALVAICAVAIGWAARFGFPEDAQLGSYVALSAVMAAGWLMCLQITGAYELRKVSGGAEEAQRVFRAALNLAGSSAIIAFFAHILIARTFIAIVIPAGVVLQLLARYGVRRGVNARRARGEWTNSLVVVGARDAVRHLIETTQRNPLAGLYVVGACVDVTGDSDGPILGVPILGDADHAAALAEQVDADVIAVAGSGLGHERIRKLSWALEGGRRSLVMAPGLTEVAGPRIHVSPVDGLPLVWVDQPTFEGLPRLVKRAMDVLGSGLLIVLAAPLLLITWLAVRLTSSGPGIYRSVRVGEHGKLITVYKFRSMYRDAELRRAELSTQNEVEGGVLFKLRSDPRVTRVGRWLRKYSLDELPQLFNVFGGSMSLVGPRPPMPDEVDKYLTHVHRRMLVRPGMTGLWQVSGRSDLSWDEAVRLDLYYVENWSLTMDLAIILRTIWVVLCGRGAY